MLNEMQRFIVERQDGLCTICGKPFKGNIIFHHIRNRCQGGQTNASNLEARHSWCETYAHQNFRYGNPGGAYENSLPALPRADKPRKLRSQRRRRVYPNVSKLSAYIVHRDTVYRCEIIGVRRKD